MKRLKLVLVALAALAGLLGGDAKANILPQDFSYRTYITDNLSASGFSTDPRVLSVIGTPPVFPKCTPVTQTVNVNEPATVSNVAGTEIKWLAPKSSISGFVTAVSISPRYRDPGTYHIVAGWSGSIPGKDSAWPTCATVIVREPEPPSPLPSPSPSLPPTLCPAIPPPPVERAPTQLEVFIVNYDQCVYEDDVVTYKVLVRNVGKSSAYNVEVSFTPPENSEILNDTLPAPYAGQKLPVKWLDKDLWEFPGNGYSEEYGVTVQFKKPVNPVTATVNVRYQDGELFWARWDCLMGPQGCITGWPTVCTTDYSRCMTGAASQDERDECGRLKDQCLKDCQGYCLEKCPEGFKTVSSSHTIPNDNCGMPDIPPEPLRPGQPAIICGPGDLACRSIMPLLGQRFKNAKSWTDPLQLGARFQEAIADILPGECRVLADDISSSPEYQDAFNRRGKPSAAFIRPLYNSGRDFSEVALQNRMDGIEQKIDVKNELADMHTKMWLKISDGVNRVQQGNLTADNMLELANKEWKAFIDSAKDAQRDFARNYADIQTERLNRFDPAATQAVSNAKQSIAQACPMLAGTDGGLEEQLKTVREVYANNLTEQKTNYDNTQRLFAESDAVALPEGLRPEAWKRALRFALSDWEEGNPEPLEQFKHDFAFRQQYIFNELWENTYEKHAAEDAARDRQVRLEYWEKALDTPKEIATNCEYERKSAAPVEATWCESDFYGQFVLRGAKPPVKEVHPPVAIPGERDGTVQAGAVAGVPCRGLPGDPYWADNCSCNCDSVGAVKGSGFAICNFRPIVRHDRNVTDILECMLDAPHHGNFYF